MPAEKYSSVISVSHLTESTYILRFKRKNINFEPGQHIGLGLPDYPYMRDYSIYSSETDNYIEVLIKEVSGGDLSVKLKDLEKGSLIKYDDPTGQFLIAKTNKTKKYTFFATGTGIAPFHSFVKSYPNLDYFLFHGVHYEKEAYGRIEYEVPKYCLITSQDTETQFRQRIPDYLRTNTMDTSGDFYLCGNGNMIYEVNEILQNMGVPTERIFFEIYF